MLIIGVLFVRHRSFDLLRQLLDGLDEGEEEKGQNTYVVDGEHEEHNKYDLDHGTKF
jgi:hypothetical protein